jgi:hypothetical protein
MRGTPNSKTGQPDGVTHFFIHFFLHSVQANPSLPTHFFRFLFAQRQRSASSNNIGKSDVLRLYYLFVYE